MPRPKALLLAGLLALWPASGIAGSLDLRLGGFMPRAKSQLFDDDAQLYTVSRNDWRGFTGGVEFATRLASHLELAFHLDGYGRTVHTAYNRYERENGREIRQSLLLNIVPLGTSLRLVSGRRHARLSPYAAVGVDAVFWKYEEFGDFIDFDDPARPILDDSFRSDGVAPGFHAAAGLGFRLNDDLSLVGEFRYQAAKTDMGEDFRGYEVDLSGASVTLGLRLRF